MEAFIHYLQIQAQVLLLRLQVRPDRCWHTVEWLTSAFYKGVAVDYLAPKWPYTVDSYVSLDGGAPVLVDMTALGTPNIDGHETVQSAALWSATGLQNTIHHLVVTIGTSGYAVVDGFRYVSSTFHLDSI